MKRILVSLGAIGLALSMTSTAFAQQVADRGSKNTFKSSVSTSVSNYNAAEVTNIVGSSASTGGNSVGAGHGDVKNVTVITGAATSSSTVDNAVNSIESEVTAPACGCQEAAMAPDQYSDRGGKNKVKTSDTLAVANDNGASVANVVGAGSTTGGNHIGTFHGDVNGIGMTAGAAMGTTMVGTVANFTSSMVTR